LYFRRNFAGSLNKKEKKRAGYGESLLSQLAIDLTAKLGRGFSRQNLQRMRQFYLQYPPSLICSTLSSKLEKIDLKLLISKSSPGVISNYPSEEHGDLYEEEITHYVPISFS